MVLSREREATERPPLSVILPRLYLGAERDVTQDRLASLGISYVLSVSRCSPQPSFLPRSRYHRIPIDDSLRDDLLPWIPQALRFIDSAMSSGSVLVHCAAGISRSPALAVAYIMYSLGMDLDHAYRFVKERRPSISPNFNFLGQLQHFQGTLSQKASDGNLVIRPLDAGLPSTNNNVGHNANQNMNYQANRVTNDSAEDERAQSKNLYNTDKVEQRYSHSGERSPRPPTLSLSGKLRNLNLTVGENQRDVQTPCELAPGLSRCEPAKPTPKPTQLQLQLPAGTASLLEKRKSLTLSLSPLGSGPPANKQTTPTRNSSRPHGSASTSKTVHKRETGVRHKAKRQSNKPPAEGAAAATAGRAEDPWDERIPFHSKHARPTPSRLEDEEQEQGPLSPLGLTVNKLLGWGERMLLGGLLGPPVRLGQATSPQGGGLLGPPVRLGQATSPQGGGLLGPPVRLGKATSPQGGGLLGPPVRLGQATSPQGGGLLGPPVRLGQATSPQGGGLLGPPVRLGQATSPQGGSLLGPPVKLGQATSPQGGGLLGPPVRLGQRGVVWNES